MGHWSIYTDDEEDPLIECWGDEEADRTAEYLGYLYNYAPERLLDREALIDEILVLIWDVYYELEVGRKATRAEIEYGLDFSLGLAEDNISPKGVPDESSMIPELDEYPAYLAEYFTYLLETDPLRLLDNQRIQDDTRILTWDIFVGRRHRPATNEELNYLVELAAKAIL